MKKILLVDDEEALIQIGKAMLERLGYTVAARTSSVEALETFKEKPHDYDLVVTDQTMPNMTGLELAKKLKTIRADIPIILCTGYYTTVTREKAQAIGIKDLLMKPFTMYELSKILKKVLERSNDELNNA